MYQAAGLDGQRLHTVAEIAQAVGVHRTTVYDYLTRRADMAGDPRDAPRHAGQVVRRVLLRRNIAIDAETAQLVAAVRAALQASAPSRRPAGARAFPPPAASRCSDPAPATGLIPGW
jgi:AcrR family transcriptional regulator